MHDFFFFFFFFFPLRLKKSHLHFGIFDIYTFFLWKSTVEIYNVLIAIKFDLDKVLYT